MDELRKVATYEQMSVVRTWIYERSPAAFRHAPYLWEAVRDWLALRCNVSAYQIGLSGSAQLGFSTSPRKALKLFDPNNSDLDVYIVSGSLFAEISLEANLFVSRQFEAEKSDFIEQARQIQKLLLRGYVDLKYIPSRREHYPRSAQLKNDASILLDKLKFEGFNLKPSHFRVYKDWQAKSDWTKIQAESWVKSISAN